jgi:8-amino-7-oxononanoate synthase
VSTQDVTLPLFLNQELAKGLQALERDCLLRSLRSVAHRRGAELLVDGVPVVDFASNDYLGLASDVRVAAAISEAACETGAGAGGARLICGNHPLHEELEREIAHFKGTEAALLFSSGYAANVGAIPALAERGDVIYSDALNHASLIDGCRLSRAKTRIFPHGELDVLEAMLRADRGHFHRRWIMVEGVFSMDGDLAPLDRLVELARRHRAWIYLDDAHGTGVVGAGGRGTAEHWGVEGEIEVVMGTLSKALGTVGAFVAGSSVLREWLLNRARSGVFTTGTPPALAAGTLAALRICTTEPERRERLWANVRRLGDGLRSLGREMNTQGAAGHIVPVLVGGTEQTMRVGAALRDQGFLVGAVRPPTVPPGTSRLRITVSAAHTPEQIDQFLGALSQTVPGMQP